MRVSLVDELLDLHHLVQSLRPLSTLILQRIQCMRIASPCVTSPPLLSLSPPHPSFSTILIRTSTCSVADLQRDHRTIDCLALTDGEISICCSVASLHPQFFGQLVQVSISAFSHQLFRIPLRICAMEGLCHIQSIFSTCEIQNSGCERTLDFTWLEAILVLMNCAMPHR